MKNILSLIAYICLTACGYDKFEEYRGQNTNVPLPTTTINDLNELCSDKALLINKQYVIQGYVTSSDKEGNFFKSFVIQDNSGAIEIMAGLYSLHNIYPIGQRIVVQTLGLSLASNNSVVQLGVQTKSSGDKRVDYIGHRSVLDKYVVRDLKSSPIEAQTVEIPELDKKRCATLVRVENISFMGEHPATWASTNGVSTQTQTTYNKFQDKAGNIIYVLCSRYARFAHKQIPKEQVAICGILEYGEANTTNNVFILKIRGLDDVSKI